MSFFLEKNTADELWTEVYDLLNDSKSTISVESRNGPIKELLHVYMCIKNPIDRWIISRFPALNPALAEVVWIINGRDDSRFLNYFNKQLPKYAGIGDK